MKKIIVTSGASAIGGEIVPQSLAQAIEVEKEWKLALTKAKIHICDEKL